MKITKILPLLAVLTGGAVELRAHIPQKAAISPNLSIAPIALNAKQKNKLGFTAFLSKSVRGLGTQVKILVAQAGRSHLIAANRPVQKGKQYALISKSGGLIDVPVAQLNEATMRHNHTKEGMADFSHFPAVFTMTPDLSGVEPQGLKMAFWADFGLDLRQIRRLIESLQPTRQARVLSSYALNTTNNIRFIQSMAPVIGSIPFNNRPHSGSRAAGAWSNGPTTCAFSPSISKQRVSTLISTKSSKLALLRSPLMGLGANSLY